MAEDIRDVGTHPKINSTHTLQYLHEFDASDFGMESNSEEYREILYCNGCKCVVVSLVCEDNYFDVIVVDKNIRISALSDYHLGF